MKKSFFYFLFLTLLTLFSHALNAQPMVLEFNTNLSAGTTVTLPLYGTVDVTVDWGDGSTESFTGTGNKDHTYASEGIYTVTISGSLTQFGAVGYPNVDKLVKCTSFGDLGLTSLYFAFHNATNLIEAPTVLPSTVTILSATFLSCSNFNFNISTWDVSNVTNMGGMFYNAPNFNQDISGWNVSLVTDMSGMFYNAANFNQDISGWNVGLVTNMGYLFYGATDFDQNIGSWNVSNVTYMGDMFTGVTLSTANYDALLIGWSGQTLKPNLNFHGGNSKYSCDVMDERAILTGAPNNWTITDGGLLDATPTAQATAMTFGTTTASTIQLNGFTAPAGGADGYAIYVNSTNSFTAPTNGTEPVADLSWNNAGQQPIYFGTSASPSITVTGLTATTTYYFKVYAYNDCAGTETYETTGLTGNITTSTPMVLEFNTNLSAGTTVTLPLYGTVDVTVDWGDGSTESFTGTGNKDHTYASEGIYTVTISGSLTQFGAVGYPNVDKLVKCTSFGDLGLTSLYFAFHNATNLIEAPTVLPSTVTSLYATFVGCSNFNFNISTWDVSNVTNMWGMFALAPAFNQDISSWNVSNVTGMSFMFQNATSFNQNISNWNVSNVTGMYYMFGNATSFNQNIGSWNVSNVTSMGDMFTGVTLSTANYDALLIGWSGQTLQPSITFNGGGSKYSCDAIAERAILTGAPNNWTITDGGLLADAIAPVADAATLSDVTAECEVAALTAPTATDNCAGTVTGTHNATLPITAQGTTVVTWTYDDGNGNTSTQTQNVIIEDVTAPVADVATLSDITTECSVSSLTAPTATDNCAATVTGTHNATLPITAQGTTVVTWTYDDGNGNTSTQTQNVIIEDVTAPVADVATLSDITTECSVSSLTAPTATDNCAATVTGTHNATLPITAQGTTVVTWTYDDGNGNTSTQNQNVVINDITNPSISCIEDQVINLNEGETFYTVQGTEFDPTTTDDNCGIASVLNDFNTTSTLEDAQLNVGTHTIVWTITDNTGNTNTCSFEVTVDAYVGIADLYANGISVYPNPTSGIFRIKNKELRIENIEITDISGKIIYNSKFIIQNSELTIDLTSYPASVYCIKVATDKGISVKKIIKY